MNWLLPVRIGAPDYVYVYKPYIKDTLMRFCSTFSQKKQQSYFGSYLAGLWEGDGHCWIPTTSVAPCGKKYTAQFCITFHKKNLPQWN